MSSETQFTPTRRPFSTRATAPADDSGPIIEFASSTGDVDRYAEIIDPLGWQLDNYRANPVFQACHCYGDITDTIGRALVTEARTDMLFQRVEFAVDANPMAKIAYGLYKGGFLHAVSVGFRPLAWEDYSSEEMAKNGGCRRKYTKAELYEVSAVSIPANPQALALAIKSEAIAWHDVDELHDLLTTLRTHSPAGRNRATAGDDHAARWLRLLERTAAALR